MTKEHRNPSRRANLRNTLEPVNQVFDKNGIILFNWDFFQGKDKQGTGQFLNDWNQDEILDIFVNLVPWATSTHITQQLESQKFVIYGKSKKTEDKKKFSETQIGFPCHSKFVEPTTNEYLNNFGKDWREKINWARFRFTSEARLIGILDNSKKTFYPIFLDKQHQFYPT